MNNTQGKRVPANPSDAWPVEFSVGGRLIGPGNPCFIIAEAGVNHNGDLALARRLVDVAADAGADAVKFQTFKAERVMSPSAPKADYQKQTTGDAGSQLDMVRALELPPSAFQDLQARCIDRGIQFLSTPFDHESVNVLFEMGVAAFKVPSGEITNWPFLELVASKGRPVVLSTGMSYLGEVDEAVRVLHAAGCRQLAILQCVSNYPAAPADINLKAMRTMERAFGTPVGYSDHSPGIEIALAAAALGACIIEKHFTLDQNLPGPDHLASLEPDDLARMVRCIRVVEAALGDGRKRPAPAEFATAAVARRSLFVGRDVRAGDVIDSSVLSILRPAGGIPPNVLSVIVGRRAARDLRAGAMLAWSDLA